MAIKGSLLGACAEQLIATQKAKKEANARQVGGKHYQKTAVQHWDFVEMHKIPYMEAQIMKYLMRWRDKNGLEDLQKASHFLEKLQEQQMKPKGEKGRFRETSKQKRALRKAKNP